MKYTELLARVFRRMLLLLLLLLHALEFLQKLFRRFRLVRVLRLVRSIRVRLLLDGNAVGNRLLLRRRLFRLLVGLRRGWFFDDLGLAVVRDLRIGQRLVGIRLLGWRLEGLCSAGLGSSGCGMAGAGGPCRQDNFLYGFRVPWRADQHEIVLRAVKQGAEHIARIARPDLRCDAVG